MSVRETVFVTVDCFPAWKLIVFDRISVLIRSRHEKSSKLCVCIDYDRCIQCNAEPDSRGRVSGTRSQNRRRVRQIWMKLMLFGIKTRQKKVYGSWIDHMKFSAWFAHKEGKDFGPFWAFEARHRCARSDLGLNVPQNLFLPGFCIGWAEIFSDLRSDCYKLRSRSCFLLT